MLKINKLKSFVRWTLLPQTTILVILWTTLTSCQKLSAPEANAQTQNREKKAENQVVAVDVAVAKLQTLRQPIEYIGTTAPVREVSLRAQIQGQLQELNVDVGDKVLEKQILARLDDNLLVSAVEGAKAEKAGQKSQVISAQSQVADALIKVEQARLQLQQAQANVLRLQTSLKAKIEEIRLEAEQSAADSDRLAKLEQQGAISTQIAEQAQTKTKQAQQNLLNQQVSAEQEIAQAQTTAQTAAKILRSAQAQVTIEQQKVTTAMAQVNAQKALITQAKTRQSYAILPSPISGKVLKRSTEIGNLIQPGTEILQIGDFSQIKITVEVSELQLSQIQPRQIVTVKLDAFPQDKFTGIVSRISPVADSKARLIPVEIIINNPQDNISSGLLARVTFPQTDSQKIIVPETAIQQDSTIFAIAYEGEKTKVEARKITMGKKNNRQVEILKGLSIGERYAIASSKPLQDGMIVRLSVLSEPKIKQ